MKKLNSFVLIFILLIIKINAQEIIKTPVKTNEFITQFFKEKKEKFEWAVPISSSERLSLNWAERKNSFTKEGIRSFVGYENNHMKATLSISSKNISGSIFTNYGELHIIDINGVIHLVKYDNNGLNCHSTNEIHNHKNKSFKKEFSANTVSIKNSDVLRIYRLAILVDYSVYSGVHFGNRDKVETFYSNIETFLNEIYIRDLGIKFEVLRDDKLIRNSSDLEVFEPRDPNLDANNSARYYNNYRFISLGTREIDRLIGKDNYDIGIVMTRSSNGGGQAFLRGGYKQNIKGAATVDTPSKEIIAHEIGHLFGARHTFSNSPRVVGSDTDQIEPGRGHSIMSYGSPRDFFALYSIYSIREELSHTPYYEDETRTFVKGHYEAGVTNIPLGIIIDNQAPIIDKSQIKTEYKIPKNTYFQFYIPATDAEQDDLYYLAHQTDVRLYPEKSSNAKFITRKAKNKNHIAFQPQYVKSGAMVFNSDIRDMGIFTFWLGVRDFHSHQPYITKYDLAETKVNIVEGIPFKITHKFENEYKGNTKINLTWNVDNNIFPTDSKVRILLSDDFGNTFKHILVEETDNDGSHEITLPNIEIGNIKVGDLYLRSAVIKIEVINGIAYALSEVDPKKGGFTIILDDTLSIDETNIRQKKLYPNPVRNVFQLNGFDKILRVKIYDLSGRLLKQFEPQIFYNISELPQGHYIVSVESSNSTEFLKMIKL